MSSPEIDPAAEELAREDEYRERVQLARDVVSALDFDPDVEKRGPRELAEHTVRRAESAERAAAKAEGERDEARATRDAIRKAGRKNITRLEASCKSQRGIIKAGVRDAEAQRQTIERLRAELEPKP